MKKKLKTYFIFLLYFTNFINIIAQNVTLNYPSEGFVTSKTFIEICFNNQTGAMYELELATDASFNNTFYTANNLTNGKTIVPNLNPNTKYFWHVRQLNPNLSAWSSTRSFTQFSVASLNNLALWLKADTALNINSGTVLTWNDVSSNQYNLTQATANRQPTQIQSFYTNKSAIKFDGNDFFEIPNFVYGLNNSAFVVGKKNSGSLYARYLGTYGSHLEICTDAIGLSGNVVASYNSNLPSAIAISRTNGLTKVFHNDSIVATSFLNVTALTSGSLYIGRSSLTNPADFLTGEIAEVIFCTSLLSDSIIGVVNHYLMDKYSEELYLGNDTNIVDNFCPLTLDANDGFTNYLWSTGETSSAITVQQSGQYWVQAKDYFGRIKYDTINVQYPTVNQLSNQTLCFGAQVVWNTGLNNNFTHLWQDNSNLNQLTITTSDQYYVSITDVQGCTFYSDTIEIIIDNFAVINSLGNDTNLCFGNTIQLQNYYNSNANYLWSTGSNSDSLVITTSGNYWVEVSNENNCILRDTIAIVIVGTAPTALFSASNGCKNTVVAFTDLSSPPLGETISQWLWDFGDGSTSNIQNNTHLFDSAGIYIVSMKVILQSGCGAIFNQSITIFDTPELSYTAFNLCNQNTTVFNNTSNLFGGTLQSVLWNFGDPSSGANAANTNQSSHNYALEGNYNINLKIETVEGCVDSSQWSINIKPSPIADFKFSNVCLGDNTMFTDASEISFPWQNLSRTWIFSNGDTSFIYQPSIVFDSAGTFQVSLQVQSTNGCRDTLIKPVTIYNTPNASLTYQKNCIGDSTLLNDSSTCVNCQITNFSWSINNNFISNNENISYLFPDTGSYNISHMVENNAGCISIIDTNINIVLPPKASFIINSSIGSPPFNAQFTNQSSFANTYTWQFGDGNFSQEVNPTHLYNDTGLFTITLKAFNSDNCMNSISQILNLKPKKIDLLIYELSTETVNEYIEITMVVFNQSTAIISGFESIISNKLNIITKENYINNIKPGEFKTIKLNTKIRQGEGLNLSDVLCIELINIEEGNDINPSNNKACSIITNNDLKLINLFPNPSIDHVSISFICPTNEEVLFEISDVSGKISSRYNYQSKAGYNEFQFSTIELAEGTYNCKLYYKGSAQSLRFVKHKQ